ncbi:MAG: MGMT family protein [Bacteroidia bacterium]|nr:MGMT family protein [Bacteroidia bacterium]
MKKNRSQAERDNFFEDVYEVVKLIPPGRVTSYGAIARYLGTGRSSRMVGYALNQCFHLNIPAHRVVNRNGMLTGKIHFPPERPMDESLRAEGVEVTEDQIMNFEKYFWDPGKELQL